MKGLMEKIRRKWMKLRLQPIRVFCFHQVSEVFDPLTMWECDWMQIDDFKHAVTSLQKQGYRFISLPEAYAKMTNDTFRYRKYAVLTADDGDATLRNVLPWLNEQKIPVTLFVNPKYLDEKHFRKRKTERYLMEEEIRNLYKQYPLLTIGSHGWEHVDAYSQTEQEFFNNLVQSVEYLKGLPNFISFFAVPYGRCSNQQLAMVKSNGIVPLLVRGAKNYKYGEFIDREILG